MFRFSRQPEVRGALDLDPVRAVLFDLDGTLIDVDMQLFVPAYLRRLADRMASYADPRLTVRTLHGAVMAMLNGTTGECTLEALQQEMLASERQIPPEGYRQAVEVFCREDLDELRPLVRPHPLARSLVTACLDKGWQVALATNPIFPRDVIAARLAWGGLDDLPFTPVTSYESCRHCKPHAGFFADLLADLELPPQACLMVGNDTLHDLAAGRYGLQTCLLTTWRIDRPAASHPADWEGPHQELLDTLRAPSVPSPGD